MQKKALPINKKEAIKGLTWIIENELKITKNKFIGNRHDCLYKDNLKRADELISIANQLSYIDGEIIKNLREKYSEVIQLINSKSEY